MQGGAGSGLAAGTVRSNNLPHDYTCPLPPLPPLQLCPSHILYLCSLLPFLHLCSLLFPQPLLPKPYLFSTPAGSICILAWGTGHRAWSQPSPCNSHVGCTPLLWGQAGAILSAPECSLNRA